MKKWVLISATLLVIVSCSDNATNTLEEGDSKGVEVKVLPDVQLNEGKRWEANPATVEGIENLTVMVESFDASVQNYDTLQSNLRDEFGLIFKNCTMKGEAHEQLHNYLFPLMELFGKLTLENREKALIEIEEHLASFDAYFSKES